MVLEILSNTTLNVCLPFFREQWGTLFTKLIILLSCVAELPGEVNCTYLQFNKFYRPETI